jgi:C-terminal processing protease CtpA/Prc
MINGLTVGNLLFGGPAYNSKKLVQGDYILKVDSIDATEQNIRELLVGNDTPGAPMEIVIGKGGKEVQCMIFHVFLMRR